MKTFRKKLSDLSIWTVFIAVGIGAALWPLDKAEVGMLLMLVAAGWAAVLGGATDD